MKKLPLFISAFLCCITVCDAQSCIPEVHFWADFSGKLDEAGINLSIYRSAGKGLVGNYRFVHDDKTVFELTGSEINCSYTFNTAKGKLAFNYTYDAVKKEDKYEGTFTAEQGKILSVKLQLATMVYGSENNRYGELFGTTPEVDSFASKIKRAFSNDDMPWLASHCSYPLNIFAGSPKPRVVKNKQEFATAYKKLFSKKFKDRFTDMRCYNMFCNHSGVMLGRGYVWINHTNTSSADKYQYCITSFNVF
jgi:hypothetical protein